MSTSSLLRHSNGQVYVINSCRHRPITCAEQLSVIYKRARWYGDEYCIITRTYAADHMRTATSVRHKALGAVGEMVNKSGDPGLIVGV
jgi:hypothetical protein